MEKENVNHHKIYNIYVKNNVFFYVSRETSYVIFISYIYVSRETLTMGQVKPLLSLDNEKQQLEVAAAIIEKGWSSRTVEDVVKELKTGRRFKVTEEAVIVAEEKANNKKGKAAAAGDVFTSDFQNRLVELLGTKFKVLPKDERKGKIEIEYYSPEDLERIYDLLNRPAQQTLKRKKPWLSV